MLPNPGVKSGASPEAAPRRRAALLVSLLAASPLFLTAAPSRSADEPAPKPALQPCVDPGLPADALCGTYEVFEDRAARSGRKIPLHLVLLPGRSAHRSADPFLFLAANPGLSGIDRGIARYYELAPLREVRDMLLVDLRGAGRSGELRCSELAGPAGIQAALDHYLPGAELRACRERLGRAADLSWYTTAAAVDDLEEIRSAFGFGPLNLVGTAHGARVALTYLQRHPAGVRTATLIGVTAPGEPAFPGLDRNRQVALDALFADCAGDAACGAAFPRLKDEIDAVLGQLARKPVEVELTDPQSGKTSPLRLTRDGAVRTLGAMLASANSLESLPLRVHQAAGGNWKPLAFLAEQYGISLSALALGSSLSVACSEDLPFLDRVEPAAGALPPPGPTAPTAPTAPQTPVAALRSACAGWPTHPAPPDAVTPGSSEVPVLLISGARDPATPSGDSERVAASLKHAKRILVAQGPNDTRGMKGDRCIPERIAAFLAAGSVEGLDTSCAEAIRRPDFELPEVTLTRAELEPLTGTYDDTLLGFSVKVDLQGDRLRLTVLAGPPFPPAFLIPVSKTRFRWEGEGLITGLAVEFQRTDGRASTLTVVEAGKPPLEMKRSQ